MITAYPPWMGCRAEKRQTDSDGRDVGIARIIYPFAMMRHVTTQWSANASKQSKSRCGVCRISKGRLEQYTEQSEIILQWIRGMGEKQSKTVILRLRKKAAVFEKLVIKRQHCKILKLGAADFSHGTDHVPTHDAFCVFPGGRILSLLNCQIDRALHSAERIDRIDTILPKSVSPTLSVTFSG